MNEITPERVAAAACEGVSGWRHSLESSLSLTAEGNVLSLAAVRWDGPGDTEVVRHFRAVVVEAPAHAVAEKPVKLPADLARELAYGGPGDSLEGWTVVADDYIGKTRWTSTHRLVIRNESGEHFADTYRKGLTESQHASPYEDESTATFTPVVPQFEVVTKWVAPKTAEAAPAKQQGGAL